jgi:hypothetical protein
MGLGSGLGFWKGEKGMERLGEGEVSRFNGFGYVWDIRMGLKVEVDWDDWVGQERNFDGTDVNETS